jgi:prepilin-type N-terminal cleavage/methylation domain-containing protein
MSLKRGFTLIELLVVIAIIANSGGIAPAVVERRQE